MRAKFGGNSAKDRMILLGATDFALLRVNGSARRKSVRKSRVADTKSQPPPKENNSPRPAVNAQLVSPTRPGHGFEININDKVFLSTAQKNGSRSSRSTPDYFTEAISSNPNPRKRSAARESEFQEPTADKQYGDRTGTGRRGKALSGGPSGKDPEFLRESMISNEAANLTRRGSSKRLFNPDTDNPSNTNRRNKAQDSAAARRIYDSRTHVFRSRKAPSSERDDFRNQKINQNFNIEQIKLEKNQSGIQGVRVSDPSPNLQDDIMEPEPEILLQPETRPISHEQLFLEVKGIYAGLLMVESKCIEVDSRQSKAALERDPSKPTKLSDEQWQALISLHKTLLHEHHDFFLASQHPSANPALSKLPEHYSMPARMWRHGIHSFLEVLRHRLPESLDHMLAFIYIAYSMVALLYETVSSFESTWIECLGDLGRYRMAIEDDMRDREVWSGVARFWYGKGADKDPDQGRLYHHLAILARHSSLQQLSLYSKALTCVTPFESARSSIMTLFSPILSGKDSPYLRSIPFETMFIKVHGMLFSGTALENYDATLSRLIDLLDRYITRLAAKFKEQGIFAAIANISALFEYGGGVRQSGAAKSILQLCFKPLRDAEDRAIQEAKARAKQEAGAAAEIGPTSSLKLASKFPEVDVDLALLAVESIKPVASNMETIAPSELETSLQFITRALKLAFNTFSVCLKQVRDKNVLPLIGVYFMFIWDLTRIEDVHGVKTLIIQEAPWHEMCSFLNTIVKPETLTSRVRAPNFPTPKEHNGRPLPEDFLMRGQWYFPSHRFSGTMVDEEERAIEVASNVATRMERILWLGFHTASVCLTTLLNQTFTDTYKSADNKFIYFDENVQQFTTEDPAQNPKVPNSILRQEIRTSLRQSPEDPATKTDDKAEEHESAMLGLSNSLKAAMHPISSSAGTSPIGSVRLEATVSEDERPDVIMIDAATENGHEALKGMKREASGHKKSKVSAAFKLFKTSEGRMASESKRSSTNLPEKMYPSDVLKIQQINAFDYGSDQDLSTA